MYKLNHPLKNQDHYLNHLVRRQIPVKGWMEMHLPPRDVISAVQSFLNIDPTDYQLTHREITSQQHYFYIGSNFFAQVDRCFVSGRISNTSLCISKQHLILGKRIKNRSRTMVAKCWDANQIAAEAIHNGKHTMTIIVKNICSAHEVGNIP